MALHYLIDGYNVLYALPEMPAGTWSEKRSALIQFLQTKRLHGNNLLTVVFDSREGMGDQSQEKGLVIVYTAGETADEWISRYIRAVDNPRIMVVVSNDQGIRASIRGTGARFVPVTAFIKSAKSPAVDSSSSEERNPEDHSDITEEFKRKWL